MSPTTHVADSNSRGIIAVLVGVLFFSIHDNVIRLLGGDYSVMEIMFFRSLFAIPVMLLILKMETGLWTPKFKSPRLMFLRGFIHCCCYISFYMSIVSLPLATATTIFFIAPILVTVISVFLFKEKVGPRRWVAVISGFAGVMIIVDPVAGIDDPAIYFALFSAISYSVSVIITRHIGKEQGAVSMALSSMLIFFLVSGLCGLIFGDGGVAYSGHPGLEFLLRGWTVPSTHDLLLLLACSLLGSIGLYGLIQAYRFAEVSFIVPFEYLAMPLAVLWGYLFWGEVPPVTTYLGIALIIGSGLYVLHRETVLKRRLSTGKAVRLRV